MEDSIPPPQPEPPSAKEVKERFSWPRFIAHSVLAVITAPYRRTFKLYTWKPLRDFRKADGDRKRLIPMVREWKQDKYAELQSVQVAASFCAGATLATITWEKIENPIWVADALWFCSLICSIWAVITSIQTKSILDDLPNKDQLTSSLSDLEVKRMKRMILRYKKTPGVSHWVMLFIWQFPSMTMSYAWCTFLAGLTVYVCTPFIRESAWSHHHKIAIVYLTVGSIGFFTYIFSTIFVYTSEKEFLRSVVNSRANTIPSTRQNTADLESALGNIAMTTDTEKQPEERRKELERHSDPVQSLREKGLFGTDRRREERREGLGKGSENEKRQLLI